MRKPTRCQLCQVVQCSKCHHGFLFCSPSPERRSGAGPPPHHWGPPPSPHFISSKAKASRVSQQHARLSRPVPTVHVSKKDLGPKGMSPAFGVTAERSHPLRLLPSAGTL